MNSERDKLWARSSHGLARIEAFMVPVLQGLARLDCQLILQDARFGELSELERGTIQESILLTDRITLSYLWVLGAYELVRTLDQRCQADKTHLGEPLTQRIRNFKRQMKRLRIPLAKMEPARRNPSDSPIAFPAISYQYGIAWNIAPDVLISRRELSDALLELVGEIREHVSPTISK